MKKIITILFTLTLLIACSNEKGYSKLSDGTDVLFKKGNEEFTKNDLYEVLKVSSEQSIEVDIIRKIISKIGLDLTDAEEKAQNYVDYVKSAQGEDIIIYQYGTVDAFKQEVLYSYELTELGKIYIDENYETLVKNDKPIEMQLVHFSDNEAANLFLSEVSNGAEFTITATKYDYNENCNIKIYLDTDASLPLEVKNYINSNNETGLSEIITVENTSTDENGTQVTDSDYYIVNITNRNVSKEEYIQLKKDALENSSSATVNIEDVKNYFFNKHEIKFYDQSIYELMKQQYEVFE